jgi:molybdenum cofactor biosynthesis enzyme MoaA
MIANAIGNMLTTRCTLRCKNCNAAIPYHKTYNDIDTGVIMKSLRRIFEIFDYVDELGLYGGEALLHPDIDEIIRECGNYSSKFGFLRLMTNGTIIPKQATLEELKKLETGGG